MSSQQESNVIVGIQDWWSRAG